MKRHNSVRNGAGKRRALRAAPVVLAAALQCCAPALHADAEDAPDHIVLVKPHEKTIEPMPMRWDDEYNGNLRIKPEDKQKWKLHSSGIIDQDEMLWHKVSPDSADEHVYRLEGAYSGQEWLHVRGELAPRGGGGGGGGPVVLPMFDVVVPEIDIDWEGYERWEDEAGEDERSLAVSLDAPRRFIVRKPKEEKLRWDDYEPLPDLTLRWNPGFVEIFTDISCAPGSRLNGGKHVIKSQSVVWEAWKGGRALLFYAKAAPRDDAPPPDQVIQIDRGNTDFDEHRHATWDSILCEPYIVDLDIDTLNHWGGEYFTTDIRSQESDDQEDVSGTPYAGKVIFVNNTDKDGDGAPDYMDGWACPYAQIARLERETPAGGRGRNAFERFAPLSLTVMDKAENIKNVRVKFIYPESKPSTMRLDKQAWHVSAAEGSLTDDKAAEIVGSPEGNIRVWKKDGAQFRNPDSDFIFSGRAYTLEELGMDARSPRLFHIEGVNASANWGDLEIKVMVSLDSGASWTRQDSVRATCVMSNFTIANARQFCVNGPFSSRTIFTPDYSSPAAFLRGRLDTEISNGKNTAAVGGDYWWHDGDASLGHGFAIFQYEGPNIGGRLGGGFGEAYDHKLYVGKTGNGYIWDYGPGRANIQSDLAWWDICPHKIDGKFLVLKKSHTVHPAVLEKILSAFSIGAKYEKFGLHIDKSINGWGCLSNVGISLGDSGVGREIAPEIEGAYVDIIAPSVANQAVMRILLAAQGSNLSKKASVIEAIADAIVGAAYSLNWGEVADDVTYETLVDRLFDELEGEIVGGILINSKSQFRLLLDPYKNHTSELRYYDPGLFPSVFGETPTDKFDLRGQ